MKPFLSESCSRTDRDVGEGEEGSEGWRAKEGENEEKGGDRLGTGVVVKTIDFK